MALTDALLDPQVRAFLPMIYVAWADGDLTDAEIDAVRQSTLARPWLSENARALLASWLDPKTPPDADALKEVLHAIRQAAGTLPPEQRCSLLHLGERLATDEVDDDVRAALVDLQEALAVDCRQAVRAFLPDQPPTPRASAPPAFDVRALQAHLDGPRAPTRDAVRALLSDPTNRIARDQSKEDAREDVLRVVRECATAGFGAMAFPGAVETPARDLGEFMTVFETLGYGDLSVLVKFGVQFGLFGGSIYFLGDEAQRAKYLPSVASGELLGCFAMTELGHGSNVMALRTRATYDAETGEWVIHTPDESARKEWIGGAATHARMATVFAQLEVAGEQHGVHALLVPIRDASGATLPGVRLGDCGHKLGLNGVDNGRIWFDQVRVPATNLLGRFAHIDEGHHYESPIPGPSRRFFTMLGTLVAGRISVASGGVSASKSGLTIALRYAFSRRQMGPPGEEETLLIDYPAHRRRLMPLLAQAYAASFVVEYARDRFVARTEEDTREVESLAATVKVFCTDHATEALQRCREACGGQGYLSENRIGPLKSDTDVFTTFEGDNTVLLLLVAKGLLTEFQRQFADERFMGAVRYLGRRVAQVATTKNPISTRLNHESHLRSREFHASLFEYREAHLVETAARRIQRRMKDGMEAHEAFTAIQNHLLAMSHAHAERVVFERFSAAAQRAEDPEVRAVLDKLCDLWSLWRIEADLGWFMENGVTETRQASALRDEVDALCDELAEDALALVDAFGIPDACIAAPIAFTDPAEGL